MKSPTVVSTLGRWWERFILEIIWKVGQGKTLHPCTQILNEQNIGRGIQWYLYNIQTVLQNCPCPYPLLGMQCTVKTCSSIAKTILNAKDCHSLFFSWLDCAGPIISFPTDEGEKLREPVSWRAGRTCAVWFMFNARWSAWSSLYQCFGRLHCL